jgi:hypothetical protein
MEKPLSHKELARNKTWNLKYKIQSYVNLTGNCLILIERIAILIRKGQVARMGDKNYIQHFNWKTKMEETTWETQT